MVQDLSPRLGAEPFSLVRNDVLFRLQRRIGLIPQDGSGLARRAVLYALISWLPLVAASWFAGAPPADQTVEPLLGHFGIHVRCLVAIPLLIIAEGLAQQIIPTCLDQFRRRGLVDDELAPRFRQVIANGVRLRDQVLPWVVIGGIVLAWTVAVWFSPNPDEIVWAGSDSPARTFGGWWYLLVTRPIFSVLLLAWLWRLMLAGIIIFGIARLPLKLVPMHPDRVGGLGFLARIPIIFSPFLFSVSAVVAASWAHGVFYHAVAVPTLYPQMGILVAFLVCMGLAPLLFFTPLLAQTKKIALLEYGVLLARHGRAVDAKWIKEEHVPDYPMLSAPELGPVADMQAMYQAVQAMRVSLVVKETLIKVAVPAALPVLIVVGTQWPLKSTLTKLLFTLL